MNHAQFYNNGFKLNGLINFNYCFFQGNVDFFVRIYKSKYEPAPTTENVRSFKSIVAKQPIKFYKSQFHFLDATVMFWVYEAARELTFIDCEIYTNYFRVSVPFVDTVTLFSLQFHKTVLSTPPSSGSLLPLNFVIYMMNKNSFIFINMSSLTLSNVALKRYNVRFLGVCIENVTWINRETFMDLDKVVSVNIVTSQLKLNCDTCPAMIIDGLECSSLVGHFYEGITGEWCLDYSKVYITETIFKIHVSMPEKNATENTYIYLKNSTFIIEGSMSFKTMILQVVNILIECPTGEMPERALSLSNVLYSCKPTCEGNNKYSLQAGILGVSERNSYGLFLFTSDPFPYH